MSKSPINPKDISIRFFRSEDIEDMVRYFYRSSPGFLESIGLKPGSWGSEDEFRNRYQAGMLKLEKEEKNPSIITVFHNDEKVGFHTTTDFIKDESLVIHAHFFNSEKRNMGIGVYSVVLASELFLTAFNLKKIIAKIPTQNKAPMRVAEKLGLQFEKIEIIKMDQLIAPMEAKVYSGDMAKVQQIKRQLGLA